MKKGKIIAIIILAFIGIAFISAGGFGLIIGIPFILLAVFLSPLGPIVFRMIPQDRNQSQNPVPDNIFFPKSLKNGQHLYKIYDRVEICIIDGKEPNFKKIQQGDKLELKKEPSNPYDERAVAIYDGAQKLGYLYGGRLQDMVHDFTNRGETILARLQEVDLKDKKLYMKMAYYKK